MTGSTCLLAQSSFGLNVNGAKTIRTEKINLYPNPATDQFTINIQSQTVKYITINNIIGKELKKIVSPANNTFNVGDLKRGVYIVRIFDERDELIKALRLSKT